MKNSISNILEIYKIVVKKHYTPDDAAREVGKKRNIDYTDLLFSCAKDLNISGEKFNYFLESKNDFNFRNFLIRRFPEHQEQIDRFFDTFEDTGDIPVIDLSKITKPSSHIELKSFNSQAILNSLKDKFLDWKSRPDIPQDVKEELKSWISKIEE
ncbi:MAG: hypothetical protein C4581_04060 [Nitrospiraceae bacterium]|nr:MAG: hypothetical protein C4581_04060 [Nitrospiraceae bacterium]